MFVSVTCPDAGGKLGEGHLAKRNKDKLRFCALVALLTIGVGLAVDALPGLTSGAQAQELEWATRAGGSRPNLEVGRDVSVMPGGHSFVTGAFSGTAVFGSDDSNRTTLTSAGDGDIFVAKYDRDGSLLWARRAGGMGNDEGFGIATTPRGEVYVTGRFIGTAVFGPGEPNQTTLTAAADDDIFVAKYDRDGSLLWARRAGGVGENEGLSIAATPRGDTYVTGNFSRVAIFGEGESHETVLTSAEGSDIFVAKYDRNGNVLWARSAGGSFSDEGRGIATSPQGGSLVTGPFQGKTVFGPGELNETTLMAARFGSASDVFLAKYDRDGALLWAKRAGGPLPAVAQSLAVTPRGESYVTGGFQGTATFGPGERNETQLTADGSSSDIFVAKYDRDGALVWAKRAGSGFRSDTGLGIATTPRGEVYVTGNFSGRAVFGPGEPNETELVVDGVIDRDNSDIFVAKYDRGGALLWARRAGGPALPNELSLGIATTPPGESFITGLFFGLATFGEGEENETTLMSAGGPDIFVAKFR